MHGRKGRLPLVALVLLTACATASELVAKGTDPDTPHADRVSALHDALEQSEPSVPESLSIRAERLLDTQGSQEDVARDRACALDIVDALARAGDKTASVLAVRLADHECPYLRSKPALAALMRHADPTVRGLAKAQLERMR